MKSKCLKVIFYSLVLSSALSAQKTEFETVLQVPDSDRMSNKVLNIFDLTDSYAVWNLRKTTKEELFFIDKNTGATLNSFSVEDVALEDVVGLGVLKGDLIIISLKSRQQVAFVRFNAKGEKVGAGNLGLKASSKRFLPEAALAYFDPSGNYLLIFAQAITNDKTSHSSLFDANLNLIGESDETYENGKSVVNKVFEIAYTPPALIDDEGNVFSMAMDGKSLLIAQRVNSYGTIKINFKKDLISVGEFIGNIQLDRLNTDTILVSGLILKDTEPEDYANRKPGTYKYYELLGHYNMLINSFNQELISENVYYFPLSEKQAWPKSYTAVQERYKSAVQFYDKRVFTLANSDYLTIVEHQNKALVGGDLRDFLIVSRHGANGETLWTKTVDKFQAVSNDIGYESYYFFSGFSSIISGNQLKLIFNQRQDDKYSGEKHISANLIFPFDLKRADQKILSFDLNTGELLSQEISNYEETEPRFLKARFSEDRYPTGPYMIMRDFDLDCDLVVKLKE